MPTTTVSVDATEDIMPLEFLQLPIVGQETIDAALPIYVSFCDMHDGYQSIYHREIHGESSGDNMELVGNPSSAKERLKARILRNEHRAPCQTDRSDMPLKCRLAIRVNRFKSDHAASPERCQQDVSTVPRIEQSPISAVKSFTTVPEIETACFATHGSYGILDLGASKTVIGSNHLGELIRSLDARIQKQLARCSCNIVFKFGNQATLTSQEALVVPIGALRLKIAIVPGGTPFLISNTLMRTLQAQINCANQTLTSDHLSRPVQLQLTAKGLFLLDLNDLIMATVNKKSSSIRAGVQTCAETFVSDETEPKANAKQLEKCEQSQPITPLVQQQPRPSCVSSEAERCQHVHISTSHSSAAERCQHAHTPTSSCSAENVNHHRISEAQVARSESTTAQHISSSSHVAVAKTSQPPNPIDGGSGEPGSPHSRGTVVRESDLRPEICRKQLCGHLAGPRVGPIHDQQVPEQPEESHRRYVKFVELKIEAMEQQQSVLPRASQVTRATTRPKAKAVAKSIATPSVISSLDGETDWDIEPEMYAPVTTAAHHPMTEDVMALQQRLLNMENALTRVIRHIENQSIQEQIVQEALDQ
eukprot:s3138_g4.t1